jgi:hypothetical protein
LLSHPHLLGRDADETDEPGGDGADHLEQECSKPRQRIIAAGENPNVGPRIEIVLNRQQEEIPVSAPLAKLGAIGVLFPADPAQQFPIGGMERDQVATTAMVRAEDEPLRRQLRESALDIARPESRAIPPDGDDLVIAKLRNSLDRVLEARRESASRLPMKVWPGSGRIAGRREKVKIGFR